MFAGQPEHIAAGFTIGIASEDEEVIRQTIHVLRHHGVNRGMHRELGDITLSAPSHRAGVVKMGCRRAASRQDKRAQRLEVGIDRVNRLLKPLDLGFDNAQRLIRWVFDFGRAQISPHVEEVVLNAGKPLIELTGGMQPADTEYGIELIDGPKRDDTGIGFGHTATIAKPSLTAIAGAGVDTGEFNHAD